MEAIFDVTGDLAPSGLFTVPAGASVRVGGVPLAPAGGPGRFRMPSFAAPDAPVEIVTEAGSRRLVVADPGPTTWVFPLAGQSNMVARAEPDGSSPRTGAVRFLTQQGEPASAAEIITSADNDSGQFLIAKRFAVDFLAAHPRDSIVFVPGAVGGTSFWNHRWNPGDDLYDNLVTLTREALAEHPAWRLRAMLFQGFETDGSNAMLATTFRRAIGRFIRAVRADLAAPELPIVFGELPPGFTAGHPEREAIRAEVAHATTTFPFTAVASSAGADDDGLHYSGAGLLTVGSRYADALMRAEANAPGGPPPVA